MPTLPLSSIIVLDRDRTDLGDIEDLMESLITWGQLMPVLLRKEDNRLIDGGRRLEAMSRLEWSEAEYLYKEDVSDADLKALEHEVNERRKPMTWKEKVIGIWKIHKMKARSAAMRSEGWSYRYTGQLMGVQLAQVTYACMIAEYLQDPNHPVHAATSATDALNVIIKLREDTIGRELAKSTGVAAGVVNKTALALSTNSLVQTQAAEICPSVDDLGEELKMETGSTIDHVQDAIVANPPLGKVKPIIPLSEMFFLMAAEDFLPLCKDESVDHFITDPPYGIDTDNMSQANTGMADIDRVEESHQVEPNLKLIRFFIFESYRILKPNGWTILWYDMDHHEKIQGWATTAGYNVMRWPFTWIKTHPCLNQQASKNWTKATEVAMCLRKGNATLISQQPTNYIACDGRPDRARYKNPYAKPQQVWQALMQAVALRGQIVCDPFGGEFSQALAAIQLGLRPLTCEKYDHHFNAGIDHIKRLYLNLLEEVDFQ